MFQRSQQHLYIFNIIIYSMRKKSTELSDFACRNGISFKTIRLHNLKCVKQQQK